MSFRFKPILGIQFLLVVICLLRGSGGQPTCDESLGCVNPASAACSYRGCNNVTVNGYTCQRWDCWMDGSCVHIEALLLAFSWNSLVTNADLGNHNYGRAPFSNTDGSWCYTTDPNQLYDYVNPIQAPGSPALCSTLTVLGNLVTNPQCAGTFIALPGSSKWKLGASETYLAFTCGQFFCCSDANCYCDGASTLISFDKSVPSCVNLGATPQPSTPSNTASTSMSSSRSCSKTPTQTPTETKTPTQTPTQTPTTSPSPTQTKTQTPSTTVTPSRTPTNSASPSVTPSKTGTPSQTPSPSVTPSNTPSPSQTPSTTQTPTKTPTNSASTSVTPSQTPSQTPSRTHTPTNSASTSVTPSQTPSQTPSRTQTPTQTPSKTVTPSQTPSNTPSQTQTPTRTPSASVTPTQTPTQTPTKTPSPSVTPTTTASTSVTPSTTVTPTKTPTKTKTTSPSKSVTPSTSPTNTPSTTTTPTTTPSTTQTPTTSPSFTPSTTASITNGASASASLTNTPTRTSTPTPSVSSTMTSSTTQTASGSESSSESSTVTPSMSSSSSSSESASSSKSLSGSVSPSGSTTRSSSLSRSSSISSSHTKSITSSFTSSQTVDPSPSSTASLSRTPSSTLSKSLSPSSTASASVSPAALPSGIFTTINFADVDGVPRRISGIFTAVWSRPPVQTTVNTKQLNLDQMLLLKDAEGDDNSTNSSNFQNSTEESGGGDTDTDNNDPDDADTDNDDRSGDADTDTNTGGDGGSGGGDDQGGGNQYSGIAVSRDTQFSIQVVDVSGVPREITKARIVRIDGLDVYLQARLRQVEIRSSEIKGLSTITLGVSVSNAAGEGLNTQFEIDDFTADAAQTVTTLATTGVVVSVAVTMSSAVAASTAATAAASTAVTAATAATTTATTTVATTTAATTSTATSTTAAATTTTSSTGAASSGSSGATVQGPPMMLLAQQLQFLTATSYQSGNYPRTLRALGKSFSWVTLNAGFPKDSAAPTPQPTVPSSSAKSLKFQAVEDVPTYLQWSPEDLLVNTIAFFALALCVILLAMLAYTVWKSMRWARPVFLRGAHARLRIASLGARLVHIAYFGLSFAALQQLNSGDSGPCMGLAAIVLTSITLGLPLTYLMVYRYDSRLSPFSKHRKIAILERASRVLRPIMADFRPSHRWFILLVQARLFSMCVGLVWFAKNDVAQSYHMLLTYSVYFAALAIRPYSSRFVFLVDVLMCTVDCITLLIPLLIHYYPVLVSHMTVIQWVTLGLQVSVIMLYTLYASVLLAQQIKIVLNTRTHSHEAMIVCAIQAKGLNLDASDSESDSDVEYRAVKCRPSEEFPMEPRHRSMWDAAIRNLGMHPKPNLVRFAVDPERSEVDDEESHKGTWFDRPRSMAFS